MIEKENFPMEDDEVPGQDDQSLNNVNPLSLEEQEQLNDENLVQRIEEEDVPSEDYGDINERTDEPSRGEEDLESFTERELPQSESEQEIGNDRPVTKNLLGDNPPGSEQKSFESSDNGDMSRDQATYPDKDLKENFRENMDKAQAEADFSKKIKDK